MNGSAADIRHLDFVRPRGRFHENFGIPVFAPIPDQPHDSGNLRVGLARTHKRAKIMAGLREQAYQARSRRRARRAHSEAEARSRTRMYRAPVPLGNSRRLADAYTRRRCRRQACISPTPLGRACAARRWRIGRALRWVGRLRHGLRIQRCRSQEWPWLCRSDRAGHSVRRPPSAGASDSLGFRGF